jgi:Bacterial Ig-like domain
MVSLPVISTGTSGIVTRSFALLLTSLALATCGGGKTDAAADTTPPTVLATSPANNATGMALNVSVSATFSEAMNKATLTATSFTLARTIGGAAVAGTVSVSGNTATFTPTTSLSASVQYTATITTAAKDAANNALLANYVWNFTTATANSYGLEWPGNGAVRRMLYWLNPFPIYDATYVFKVFPRKKIVPTNSPTGYYTTFFWGNNGDFFWDGRNSNTYYGAHPYPTPPPNGPGQWEISVAANDFVTGSEVQWDRWYTQAFRAWRESPSITHHEFYWDLPDTSKVITHTVVDAGWASTNPPVPAIVMGQSPNLNGASWGGYPGWEEFNGIIRGVQIYSGLLSVTDIQSEIASPMSTTAGRNAIWYLNLNPRPSDVTDKKGTGTPHNPSWDGTTALEWVQ